MEKQDFIEVEHDLAVDMALSMYIGKTCQICGKVWNSLDELKKANPICVNKKPLKFACQECFKEQETSTPVEAEETEDFGAFGSFGEPSNEEEDTLGLNKVFGKEKKE